MAARGGKIDFTDPNFEHRRYSADAAYRQSKLANQAFALELDRRLRSAELDIASVAAHPGYTATGLIAAMARAHPNRLLRAAIEGAARIGDLVLAQNVRIGVLPQLFAATAPGVNGGDYIGPAELSGLRGHPTFVRPLRAALDRQLGTALWELTAKLTGVTPDPE
jgi:NAD(P)-dependent dehydrogenase (short-subunit alcohol dehydrogenase family)